MKKNGVHIFGRPIGLILLVIYKVVWGWVEIMVGSLLVLSQKIVRGELDEDPQDTFINGLLHRFHFDPITTAHYGWLFLALGAVKLLLAAGLWYSSWLLRRVLMVFLGVIGAYALFDLARHLTVVRVITLAADIAAFFYIWKVLPKHLKHRHASEL